MWNKRLLIILIICLLAAGAAGLFIYRSLYSDNVRLPAGESTVVKFPGGTSFEAALDTLQKRDLLKNYWTFRRIARIMELNQKEISGRYRIRGNTSNVRLARMLRGRQQEAVEVILRPVRNREALVDQLARQFEDSTESFEQVLDSLIRHDTALNEHNFYAHFIPNTYRMYWNTPPVEVYERLFREQDKFWNENNRLDRARTIDLEPEEVYTLASIVDRETNLPEEKAIIAGVYLNRLERNMPLQADPTIVYALKDFTIQRVLHRHLEVKSPYNTYKNTGLPPGPIGMATIGGIDSVLAARDHDYLYFCARAGSGDGHVFASDLQGHLRNAREFHRWLNRQNIK